MNCKKCLKTDCEFYKSNKHACKECHRAQVKQWKIENSERRTTWQNEYDWDKYGIADLQRAHFVKNTVKQCAICSVTSKLQVDHCHVNGTVRSMLCGRCNRSLGGFGDNPELLKKAADYVETYQDQNRASISAC